MNKVLVLFAAGCFAVASFGCAGQPAKARDSVRDYYVELHKETFGCPPADHVEPERELNAEGPRDDVKRDIFGNVCGEPVYIPKCDGK